MLQVLIGMNMSAWKVEINIHYNQRWSFQTSAVIIITEELELLISSLHTSVDELLWKINKQNTSSERSQVLKRLWELLALFLRKCCEQHCKWDGANERQANERRGCRKLNIHKGYDKLAKALITCHSDQASACQSMWVLRLALFFLHLL